MSGDILEKVVKDVACEQWGWVAGRVVGFFNLDVTEVAEFGSGVRTRALSSVVGVEEGSNSNMTNNEISKAPSKSIYIYHNIATFVNNSEMITQNLLRPATNHRYCTFIFEDFFHI